MNYSKAPSYSLLFSSIGGALVAAGIFQGIMLSQGSRPHTLSNKWIAATKEYMKFQKMNPIFGISKDL